MYCRTKKRFFKRKPTVILSAVLLVGVLVLLHFNFNVNPIIRKVSEEKIRALTILSINKASAEVAAQNYAYDDLIKITYDTDGNVALIQANAILINTIARGITLKAQENLSKMEEQGIPVPLGSFSGITVLAGRGPAVTVKALPIGSVATEFDSEFLSAGINQTIHKISLTVAADVNVVLPGKDCSVKTRTYVLMCENVIVGKVPDFYFGGGVPGEMLDLAI
ncbi:MAG: sporulation protein YunB [Clostridiales bacterium]|jgi:sporulation protein YunB|nr:sporulation protein YunB [Clostridiales bacterium]